MVVGLAVLLFSCSFPSEVKRVLMILVLTAFYQNMLHVMSNDIHDTYKVGVVH
jgi:hypothetical protein